MARGYPPRTCRCPPGRDALASSVAHSPCAASSCPRRWRITGNLGAFPAKEARSTAGQGKGLRGSMFRGTHLAAAIGRIAVGRDQQRHMVVIVGGGDAETQHHLVEGNAGSGNCTPRAIVVASVEHQLIDPGTEVLACSTGWSQRAVVVGQGGGDQFQLLAFYPGQLDLDAMAGAAVCGTSTCVVKRPMGGGLPWRTPSSCLR